MHVETPIWYTEKWSNQERGWPKLLKKCCFLQISFIRWPSVTHSMLWFNWICCNVDAAPADVDWNKQLPTGYCHSCMGKSRRQLQTEHSRKKKTPKTKTDWFAQKKQTIRLECEQNTKANKEGDFYKHGIAFSAGRVDAEVQVQVSINPSRNKSYGGR